MPGCPLHTGRCPRQCCFATPARTTVKDPLETSDGSNKDQCAALASVRRLSHRVDGVLCRQPRAFDVHAQHLVDIVLRSCRTWSVSVRSRSERERPAPTFEPRDDWRKHARVAHGGVDLAESLERGLSHGCLSAMACRRTSARAPHLSHRPDLVLLGHVRLEEPDPLFALALELVSRSLKIDV